MHISIQQLQKEYTDTMAVNIPSLEIKKGELVGIAGNNGAGKTTLLRLILDLIEPTLGHVKIDGEQVNETTQWKRHTGSFLDEGFLIGFLTPEEYFLFNGETYGLSKEETMAKISEYNAFMSGEVVGSGKYIRQLSTGNKQKAGIIAAMMVEPRLLILDEPFNFLDPSSQIIIRNMLRDRNRTSGNTMLISSHNINHLAEICSRIILLEKGLIINDIYTQDKNSIRQIEDYFSGRAGA